MQAPKKRHTKGRRNRKRFFNNKISISRMVKCSNCGTMTLPHRSCRKCGYYKGQEVVNTAPKTKSKK